MMQHEDDIPALLTFPARFPIKVMGRNTPEFQALVLKVAGSLIPAEKLLKIEEKPSSNGRYLGVTVIAVFDSQAEIDAVYQALSGDPLVIMAL